MKNTVETHFLNIENCNDELITYLVTLINTVYNVAEKNIWLTNDSRINSKELTQLISNNKIIVAKENNDIIGLVTISHLSKTIAGFGMLSTHHDYQGKGIGSILVNTAENWAKEKGYSYMQLELLIPVNYKNDSKTLLTKWYTKLDYKKVRTEPFELTYPEKAKLLAYNCHFTIWQKSLI